MIKDVFIIFNGTDRHYATQDVMTFKKATEFIDEFPKRYEQQGYYRTGDRRMIDAADVN